MYKLETYVPVDSAELVKKSLFAAGCGKTSTYSECCWQTTGTGQFKCSRESSPAIGKPGSSERVPEVKIETTVGAAYIQEALAALREAHPYEVPAYSVMKLEFFN